MPVQRILEILVIPVVGLIIIGRCLYGSDIGIDIWMVTSTIIYASIFLLRRSSNGQVKVNWIDWSLFIVVLSETICYLNSTYRPNSLHGYHEILFLFLFYCFVRLHLRHEYQQIGIFLLITLFGLYLSVTAGFSFYRQYTNIILLGFTDVTTFRQTFNFLQMNDSPVGEWITIYLILLPFPILLFIRFANTASKSVWLLMCPVITILIIVSATFSRGLYIATFAFFVTASLLFWLYSLTSLKQLIRFNICALLLLFCILSVTPLREPILTTLSLFKTTSQVRSFEGRAGLWKESWRMVKDHPLFGVGSLNYPMQYGAYKGEDSVYVGRTFNIFLQLLVEKGIVGLLAYCLLFFSFFKVSHSKFRLLRGESQKTVMVMFMSLCVALIVRDLSYSSIFSNKGVSVLLWFIFANNAGPSHIPALPSHLDETN